MAKEKRKISEERRAELAANLARGRATAAANRAAKRIADEEAWHEASAKDDLTGSPRVAEEMLDSTLNQKIMREAAANNVRTAVTFPDDAVARRQRLLGDLDPETAALFTDDELEKIEREERTKASEEQKKQALADVRATARQMARIEHDLIAPSTLRSEAEQKRLAEPVRFRVTLPGDGAGHQGRNGLLVDGFLYQVGQTYTRPRAIFESLQANTYLAWRNEVQFKTLDQHKAGGSAVEVLSRTMPQFEVMH